MMLLGILFQKQTDGRISAFTHQVAPDYLRTKPEPDVEAQEKQLLANMSRLNPENVQVVLSLLHGHRVFLSSQTTLGLEADKCHEQVCLDRVGFDQQRCQQRRLGPRRYLQRF